MDQRIIDSLRELNDFIQKHDLKDNYSSVHFSALIDLETSQQHAYKVEVEIRVFTGIYNRTAELTFTKHNLDFEYYPTQFFPDFQTFTHVNNSYLQIEGIHTNNQKIGKYLVKIFPKNRL